MKVFVCQSCQQEFEVQYPASTRPRKYCSPKCSREARKGMTFPSQRGKGSPRYKGGRQITRWGYVYVLRPDRAKRGKTGLQNYIAEHRLVMERKLRRPLAANERVHHKNGIKTDNRPANLELWIIGHPPGQRVEDAPHCPTCTCYLQTKT